MPLADEPTDEAVAKLQTLVRIPTVSDRDPAKVDTSAFARFLEEHERLFPRLYGALELTRVGGHGLLFHWAGASDQRPVVLMAHLDVVPVDESAPWQHPPFGAEIHGGAVWGRGTLDDKGCVVAISEAVERLLDQGLTPAQDVWLSFGSDEEVSGTTAIEAVAELTRRGVEPWMVIDEGGAVAGQAFPGVKRPVGAIGVTEKGTTSVELRVGGRGGHASTPARNGPTARLARAILEVDRASMAASIPAPTIELFRRLAPHASLPLRPLLANAERLRPALTRALLAAGPESAAMTRTTFATTTLQGSPALNVIASSARAGINIRVMVGDTVADVMSHLRKVIGDSSVEIEVVEEGEASPVSPVDDDAFRLIESTVAELFPEAVPAPYVMMAATDSRHFTHICKRVYRFAPFRMSKAQRQAIHSYDEHLGVDDFLLGIDWYQRLIERLPE
jgi:carboxypeptidase PM20D1